MEKEIIERLDRIESVLISTLLLLCDHCGIEKKEEFLNEILDFAKSKGTNVENAEKK